MEYEILILIIPLSSSNYIKPLYNSYPQLSIQFLFQKKYIKKKEERKKTHKISMPTHLIPFVFFPTSSSSPSAHPISQLNKEKEIIKSHVLLPHPTPTCSTTITPPHHQLNFTMRSSPNLALIAVSPSSSSIHDRFPLSSVCANRTKHSPPAPFLSLHAPTKAALLLYPLPLCAPTKAAPTGQRRRRLSRY